MKEVDLEEIQTYLDEKSNPYLPMVIKIHK
jgi:hypothetical protein